MTVIFCANDVRDSQAKLRTGGLCDRLKGLSTYLRFCLWRKAQPVVIWDHPYLHSHLFKIDTSILFKKRDFLKNENFIVKNILHKRLYKCRAIDISQLFETEQTTLLFCNVSLNISGFPLFFSTLKNANELELFSLTLEHLLFEMFGLKFLKPSSASPRTRFPRISFHFRMGGQLDGWTDPVLSNADELIPRFEIVLDCIRSHHAAEKIEIGICGDCSKIKNDAMQIANSLGYAVLENSTQPFHIDRSVDTLNNGLQGLLTDIDMLAYSDFVFTTAGSFGKLSANYRKTPHGSLFNQYSLKHCLNILQNSNADTEWNR